MRRLALALALIASPANADMSYPPERYDIGGTTAAEVIQSYRNVFGMYVAPITIVPLGQALEQCDRLWMERWGLPYPRAEIAPGQILFGCMVRNLDWTNPVIVVSSDPGNPELVVRLMRHEIGHLLGWPGDHRR